MKTSRHIYNAVLDLVWGALAYIIFDPQMALFASAGFVIGLWLWIAVWTAILIFTRGANMPDLFSFAIGFPACTLFLDFYITIVSRHND